MTRIGLIALGLLSVATACTHHDFEPPDRAERVRRATLAYSAAVFDTIEWASPAVRASDGNAVYAAECRRCHGTLGLGDTDYARERDLEVPSLVDPEWDMAAEDTLRRMISIGHESGMPVYGDGDLAPREVDSVVGYLLFDLRPEVLGAN
jgi:mono/diheme cytochrome c family protein